MVSSSSDLVSSISSDCSDHISYNSSDCSDRRSSNAALSPSSEAPTASAWAKYEVIRCIVSPLGEARWEI
ncbi:hypothetical protein L1987_64123 [Smallanthus sonchifolius]|uniref:Uncharacterized protein n=1 Tax=Smallanthus sonchifolius TaxID=185202 RepID=A0ACB9CF84_9ASTR|nr:hypothetical protein L1987_64123 [Smallanthus sonchifolius]